MLLIGKYALLDKMMKYIIIVLTICTIVAVTIALKTTDTFDVTQVFSTEQLIELIFIAFLGWMPAPLDISVWQ